MLNYGLENEEQAVDIATKVVSTFGGGFKVVQALIGICCVETHLGQYPDRHPNKWGVGITQFDRIGFEDVKRRTRKKDRLKLLQFHGYDLENVQLEDLAADPELAICFARLKYKLRPELIPSTILGQAKYWKKFYNSLEGDGTTEHYLECWHTYAPHSVRF